MLQAPSPERAEDEEAPSPERADDFRQAIFDAQREVEAVKEKEKLERMLEDHKKSCTQ